MNQGPDRRSSCLFLGVCECHWGPSVYRYVTPSRHPTSSSDLDSNVRLVGSLVDSRTFVSPIGEKTPIIVTGDPERRPGMGLRGSRHVVSRCERRKTSSDLTVVGSRLVTSPD